MINFIVSQMPTSTAIEKNSIRQMLKAASVSDILFLKFLAAMARATAKD
jgi:hypothetical protein